MRHLYDCEKFSSDCVNTMYMQVAAMSDVNPAYTSSCGYALQIRPQLHASSA